MAETAQNVAAAGGESSQDIATEQRRSATDGKNEVGFRVMDQTEEGRERHRQISSEGGKHSHDNDIRY